MPRYAAPADLAAYTGIDAPAAGAEFDRQQAQLDRAADIIARVTRTARMPIDSVGVPTVALARTAVTRATCAQVTYWGESLDETGAGSLYDSVKMAGVELTRARTSSGSRHPSGSRLAPAALDILTAAGLFGTAVYH